MRRSRKALLGAGALAVLIQLVPLDRTNPPVIREFAGPPQVRDILARSCYDCHSHLTRWPWYSRVAPVSFLVVHDVKEGREKLNFSAWEPKPELAAEIIEVVGKGEMPLGIYTLIHPQAKLSGADLTVLQRYFDQRPSAESD